MNDKFASPLCYAGNKTRLLPLIHQYLPKNCNEIIDVFGGSGVVCFSTDFENIVYNEKDTHVYNLIKTIKECDLEFMLERIDFLIRQFDLSKNNKESYINFRHYFNDIYYKFLDDYNQTIRNASNLVLLVLVFFSFNHFITFNKEGKFMTPSGYKRSSYNKSIKNNLIKFKEKLDNTNNMLFNLDFRKLFSIYDNPNVNLSDKIFFIDLFPINRFCIQLLGKFH